MSLIDSVINFFKEKDSVTQADVLGEIKKQYPQYAKVEDARLASAVAAKKPDQFGYLSTYDPKAVVSPDVVPKNLRDRGFYERHTNLAYNDANNILQQAIEQKPELSKMDPMELAKGLETKYPQLKDLSWKLGLKNTGSSDPFIVGNPKGLIEKGNVDINNRPKVKNADGSVSTVLSMSFGTDKGEVLVPMVSDSGKIFTEKEAMDNYRKTGKNLGIFKDENSATGYAKILHTQQENRRDLNIAEKAVGMLSSFDPYETIKKVVSPITKTQQRVVSVIPDSDAVKETFQRIKAVPEAVENKVIQKLLTVPKGGVAGTAADTAMAGIMEFNGVYNGLTGDTIEVKPESLKAMGEGRISPEFAYGAGQVVGGLALLGGVSSILKTGRIAEAVGSAFYRNPALARYLAPAAVGAADFGAAGAVKEGLTQVREGKLDLEKFGKVVLIDTALGAGFGGINGIPNGLARVAGASAYGFGTTLAQGGSLMDATVNSGIMGLFTVASAPDVTKAQKLGAYKVARENVRSAMEQTATQKGYTPEVAKDLSVKAETEFTKFVEKKGGFEKLTVDDYEAGAKGIREKLNGMVAENKPESVKPAEIDTVLKTETPTGKADAPIAPITPKEPIIASSNTDITPKVVKTPNIEELQAMRSEIAQGEAGSRIHTKDSQGYRAEIIGQGSTFPEYFKNQGLSKDSVLNIIDKKIEGKKLTDSQENVLNILTELRTREKSDSQYRLEQNAIENAEDVPVGELDLNKGDKVKFIQDGKIHDSVVESISDGGDIKLVDGIEKTVDVFDQLKVVDVQKVSDVKNPKKVDKGLQQPITSLSDLDRILGVTPKSPKGGKGFAGGGGQTIDAFEQLNPGQNAQSQDFKLFDEVKNVVKKYVARVGEKYQGKRNAGVFYGDTNNVRLRALNNVSVAAHEAAHSVDINNRVIDPIMGKVGSAYNPKYRNLRKQLSDIYVEYYPGGKRNHELKTRMREGIATLIQKFVESPTNINQKYPELVKTFLQEGGEFHSKPFVELVKDMHGIVKRYQELDPLHKVGARVTSNLQQKEVKDTFLNFREKFVTEIADNMYPIEKMGKIAGVNRTENDPSLWARQYNNSNVMILNNLRGSKGFWIYSDGEFRKVSDTNIGDLVDQLSEKGLTDEFGYWLVARRQYFSYQRLDQMKDLAFTAVEAIKEIEKMKEHLDPGELKDVVNLKEIKALRKAIEDYKKFRKVLENDGFDREVVTQAYEENKTNFEPYAKQFDTFTASNLKMLADPEVRLLSSSQYSEMISNEGYASFKRDVYDELVGTGEGAPGGVRVGKNKVSSTLSRKGSELAILNPLYSLVTDHAEIVRKSLKQIVYNKIEKLSGQFPELFQELQLEPSVDSKTGAIIFPQEKDPNIVMARNEEGKRVPLLTSKQIKEVLDSVLNKQNMPIFERLLRASSRVFTKGTTGLYPQFAATNILIDQITGAANTRNKFIPLYDPLNKMAKVISDNKSAEAKYFHEYMILGGERQTMVRWQDLGPEELFNVIKKEKTGLDRAVKLIEDGVNILGIPSEYSEIFSRATEYIKSREAGNPQIVALEDAGRVTAPFHHIGRWGGGTSGQTFIRSIPFFNPAIQVLAQSSRAATEKETRSRSMFVRLAVIASLIASAKYLMEKSTDEQLQLYKDLEPKELTNYIWVPSPNGKSLLKVKIPLEMGWLGTVTNMALADMKLGANYKAGDYFDAATAFLPDQFDVSDPARAFFSWLPHVIQPAISVATNKRTYPKIRPLESQSLEGKEPRFRFNENTSAFAKFVGNKLNLSPIKIEYLIEGYLGRTTRFFTGKTLENPLVRNYYFTAGRNLQDYYETRDEVRQSIKAVRDGQRLLSPGETQKIYRQQAIIKNTERQLESYRRIERLDKNSEDLIILRRAILDNIGELENGE